MERSCQRCGERFQAKRADKIYCSGACKQAAVRARRGVRVSRGPPEPQHAPLADRLAEIEDRQRSILTDLDELEGQFGRPHAASDALLERLDALEARVKKMGKVLEAFSGRQREHEAALTKMAELLAAEPWRMR